MLCLTQDMPTYFQENLHYVNQYRSLIFLLHLLVYNMAMKQAYIIVTILVLTIIHLGASDFSFRKYNHVKEFYASISNDTLEVAKIYKLPPAAILAIAGLESGYGSGYVSQITGNILSLGAFRGDYELPSVYLPYSKSKKCVLISSKEFKQCSENDLVWKKRPKSLKRDYRPLPYAGTSKHLDLLLCDPLEKNKAQKACLHDFATRWIVKSSKVRAFRDARIWLDKLISQEGIDILFNMNTNIEFIKRIGGIPHSFNYRQEWPKKVTLIMKKAGLVELTNDIYFNNMDFDRAWRNI